MSKTPKDPPDFPDNPVMLIARATPYSSTVGGGVTLEDEQGRARFMVMFIGTTDGITKEENDALARNYEWFVNEMGQAVPARKA